jgi:hypothetical protein
MDGLSEFERLRLYCLERKEIVPVPDPPPEMPKRQWGQYYQKDLKDAIGEEFIDHDYQVAVTG